MTAKRIAIVLATCGMVLCLPGTAIAARVVNIHAGHIPRLFLWTLLPLSLAVVSCRQIARGGAMWTVWAPVGALWGFVVAAAWSLGPFYAPGGLLLLLATVVHLIALGGWRHAPLAMLWFTAGMTSLGPVFLTLDWIRSMTPGVSVDHAEAVVVGSWVFLGTFVVLGLWELSRRR
jgi:hypothetical protein